MNAQRALGETAWLVKLGHRHNRVTVCQLSYTAVKWAPRGRQLFVISEIRIMAYVRGEYIIIVVVVVVVFFYYYLFLFCICLSRVMFSTDQEFGLRSVYKPFTHWWIRYLHNDSYIMLYTYKHFFPPIIFNSSVFICYSITYIILLLSLIVFYSSHFIFIFQMTFMLGISKYNRYLRSGINNFYSFIEKYQNTNSREESLRFLILIKILN